MYISSPTFASKHACSATKWHGSPSLVTAVAKRIQIHAIAGVGEYFVHPLNLLPEPLSHTSAFILLDLAVLHLSLLNYLGPNHELAIGRAILQFFFLRTFLHSTISSAFITCCRFTVLVTCPSLSAPVSPLSSAKSSIPRHRTSTHSPCRLPRRLFRSSAENFAALLLPRLRAPVDSTCAMPLFGGRLPLVVSF